MTQSFTDVASDALVSRMDEALKRLDALLKDIGPKVKEIGELREQAAVIQKELERRGDVTLTQKKDVP